MAIFSPNLLLKDVTYIDKKLLNKHNIKALILDVDNTLTTHGSQHIEKKIYDWLYQMEELKIKMMIVSNNTNSRVKPFADRLGIDFVAMGCKPLTFGFTRAKRRFNVPTKQIAIVGDQVFTDILGGNLKGMFTILVTPFKLEEDKFFKFKRKLEKHTINKYKRKNDIL
ncbi:MAG: YqeG family HAD IIIA-type phosphatase [Oscillospiraceae bacterium]